VPPVGYQSPNLNRATLGLLAGSRPVHGDQIGEPSSLILTPPLDDPGIPGAMKIRPPVEPSDPEGVPPEGRRTIRFTRKTAARFGSKGGTSTYRRHGRERMQEIGRRGFAATCERHFGGSRRAMLDDLVRRGLASLDLFPANEAWQNFTAFPDALEESWS
jgi:hypothetical protein